MASEKRRVSLKQAAQKAKRQDRLADNSLRKVGRFSHGMQRLTGSLTPALLRDPNHKRLPLSLKSGDLPPAGLARRVHPQLSREKYRPRLLARGLYRLPQLAVERHPQARESPQALPG